jgi:hypothetical protein
MHPEDRVEAALMPMHKFRGNLGLSYAAWAANSERPQSPASIIYVLYFLSRRAQSIIDSFQDGGAADEVWILA